MGPAALQGFNFLIAVKTSTSGMVTTAEFALKGGIALSGKKDFIWSRKAELMAFATSKRGVANADCQNLMQESS